MRPLTQDEQNRLYFVAFQCVTDLDEEQGVVASARTESYGCLFGRDSAITVLKLLRVHQRAPNEKILDLCRRTLLTHDSLQGKTYNLESGEEPGKYIHEYRPDNYERLIKRERPWYVYDDGKLRNYDSIDATPLLLLAMHRYFQVTKDPDFLRTVLPGIKQGLRWLITDADKNNDHLVEYELPAQRISGGLVVQSWTDSMASLVQSDGSFPTYPITAVEVQAITWACLRTWATYFTENPDADDKQFPHQLRAFADTLQLSFLQQFLLTDNGHAYAAQAIDGKQKVIPTITANPLLCLWASVPGFTGGLDAIVSDSVIKEFVARAFEDDLFDPQAGMRTMSRRSPLFDPTERSYHNGSFWPMLDGLIHEGLVMWGFTEEAERLRQASLHAIKHFDSPIELFCSVEPGKYFEYTSASGKHGCRYQAWTAAAMLDWLTPASKEALS